jgi:hypothetical protein
MEMVLQKEQVLYLVQIAMVQAKLECNKDFFQFNKHVLSVLVQAK